VARFMSLWRANPSAPWPADPSKLLEFYEMIWATIDGLIKKGEIEEWGIFPDANVGFVIGKGETVDVFRNASMFIPYFDNEIHEIISYEKAKEILRANLKARIKAMKK
jgi:hypothetical protein